MNIRKEKDRGEKRMGDDEKKGRGRGEERKGRG